MPRHHVLIGNGPASMSAAETIRAQDPSAEITLVCAEPYGYYSRPGLAYYLAKEIPEKELAPFTARDLAQLRLTFINEAAVSIDPAAHTVTTATGRPIGYDRLLLATGSLAIPAGVPGAELDGVVKLDDMDDARDLIARSRRAKEAVVVGGGITALEIVEGMRERDVRIHYFMRKERYWSNVMSETESHIVEEGLRSRGVVIHYFTELAAILGRNGRVVAVETAKGERIPADIVAIAIGVRPQIGLAKAAGLECSRGVCVDEYLRTSDPDIFAAGDIAEVLDPPSGERVLEVLWSSAVNKGRVAGANMAGEPRAKFAKGAAALNVTRLAGFKITIIGTVGSGKDSDVSGLSRGDSQIWRELGEALTFESPGPECNLRITIADDTLVGAVVMGDQALSFPLQDLVGARADVSAYRERLAAPGVQLATIVDEIWRDWKEQRV